MELCKCCNQPIEDRPIPIFSSGIQSLYHLGSCYPLYFHFVKYCIGLLIICFLFTGIYSIVSSYQVISNSPEGDHYKNSTLNHIHISSIFPKMINTELPNSMEAIRIQAYLNLGCVIIILILFQIFKDYQADIVREVNHNNITPGDYTIMIGGVEGKIFDDHLILKYLQENGLPNLKKNQVKRIILTYNIDSLMKLNKERTIFSIKRSKVLHELELQNKTGANDSISGKLKEKLYEYSTIIDGINKSIVQLSKDINEGNIPYELTGTIFITFNTRPQTKRIKKTWKKMWFTRLFHQITCTLGNHLRIKRAPEPGDIFWQNLHFGGRALRLARIRSFIFSALSIISSFVLIFILNALKQDNTTLAIGIICSIFIVIINSLLINLIEKLSYSERPKSYTHLNTSIAEKLSLAQFINTALVTFFIQIADAMQFELVSQNENDLLSPIKRLIYDIFCIFCSNALFTPILSYFSVEWYIKKYKQNRLKKLPPSQINLIQKEANKIFEGCQVNMANNYSNIIQTMFLTAFYAPMLPIGLIISGIGLILTYHVDKVILLRRCMTPLELGKELSKIMTEYLEFFPFLISSGNIFICFYLKYQLNIQNDDLNEACTVSIVCWAISLIHLLIPTRHYHKKVFRKTQNKLHTIRYEEIWLKFDTDYDRSNPATRNKAEIHYLKALLALETNEEIRVEIGNEIKGLLNGTIDHNLDYDLVQPKYISHRRVTLEILKQFARPAPKPAVVSGSAAASPLDTPSSSHYLAHKKPSFISLARLHLTKEFSVHNKNRPNSECSNINKEPENINSEPVSMNQPENINNESKNINNQI